jgi:hypothetical protein
MRSTLRLVLNLIAYIVAFFARRRPRGGRGEPPLGREMPGRSPENPRPRKDPKREGEEGETTDG